MCYDWELKHFEFVTEQNGDEKKGEGDELRFRHVELSMPRRLSSSSRPMPISASLVSMVQVRLFCGVHTTSAILLISVREKGA